MRRNREKLTLIYPKHLGAHNEQKTSTSLSELSAKLILYKANFKQIMLQENYMKQLRRAMLDSYLN